MNKMNKMIHFDPPCNTTNVKMNKMYYFDPPYNSARVKMNSFSFILIMSSKDDIYIDILISKCY